jgi:hypothetical protein
MKEQLIEEIKNLIKINPEEIIDINPAFLEYFQIEELIDMRNLLELKKKENFSTNSNYLDELYEKIKKDEI